MKLFKYVRLFFLLQLLFVVFGILSVAIPNKSVKKNIQTSLELYGDVPQYDKPVIDKPGHQADNFTDFLILGMMYNSKSDNIKESLLFPSTHFVEDTFTHSGRMLEYSIAHQDEQPQLVYGRYWHGSMFAYKFLFLTTHLSDVRWLNFLICTVVLFVFAINFYKRFRPAEFYLTLLSLVFVNYYMIFHSMQFTPVFIIAFLGAVTILKRNELNKELYTTFLIIGACTAYFDLLTVPMITLGLPLLCWVLRLDDTSDFKKNFFQIVRFGAIWVLGYVGTWFFKWLLIAGLTDYSIMEEINFKVSERAGVWQGSRLDAIIVNLRMIHLVYLCCTLLGLTLLSVFFRKRFNGKKVALLLVVAIMPLVWIFVTANHSEMHNWFVYRCLLVFIMGVFLAYAQIIDWQKAGSFFSFKRKTKKSLM